MTKSRKTDCIQDTTGLIDLLEATIGNIGSYLSAKLRDKSGFTPRSFYGESFTALLFSRFPGQYADDLKVLYEKYAAKDKADPQFHWEFNKYAWVNLYKRTGDEIAKEFALPLRFKNTSVTNWTLLRSCTRFHAQCDQALARAEATEALTKSQKASGLICDQPNVRSFQYHCFSAVMAAEITELGGGDFFVQSFLRAVEFISNFVLRNGDTLYVGRGQQQSFGYGALSYLLALAWKHTGNPRYLTQLKRVLGFLTGFERNDGSFPLVLNSIEKAPPTSTSVVNPNYPGWYHYNNFYDYLPFMGVFLGKTADVLGALPAEMIPAAIEEKPYRDPDFIVSRNSRYEAVLSRPNGGWKGNLGYWTNDLPIPYICMDGVRITPSCGGEEYGDTIYKAEGIPLPLLSKKEHKSSIRKNRIWSCFLGNFLLVLTFDGILFRRFRFGPDSIIITDLAMGRKPLFGHYLFEIVNAESDRSFSLPMGAKLYSRKPLVVDDEKYYFCGGAIDGVTTCDSGIVNRLEISLKTETRNG